MGSEKLSAKFPPNCPWKKRNKMDPKQRMHWVMKIRIKMMEILAMQKKKNSKKCIKQPRTPLLSQIVSRRARKYSSVIILLITYVKQESIFKYQSQNRQSCVFNDTGDLEWTSMKVTSFVITKLEKDRERSEDRSHEFLLFVFLPLCFLK